MKYSNITKKLTSNNAALLILIYSSILLSLIIVLAFMMRPVADDYAYFSDPLINNPFKFTIHYYMDWTGRSGQAFWMSSLYNIFGNQVVLYGVILQHVIFTLVTIFFTYTILYKKINSHISLIALSLLIVACCTFMPPSLFDSNLWITSSTVYIGSLIGMFLSIGVAVLLLRVRDMKKWHYILAFAITFIAQLFSEPTSLIMIYLGMLSITITLFIHKSRSGIYMSATYLTASVLGFLYMLLSPGTRTRQGSLDIETSILDSLVLALSDLTKLEYIFTSYRILIIIILALFISLSLHKLSKRNTVIVAALASISAILIPYSLFISTRYTMGTYIPLRAFTVPVGIAAILLAIVIGVIVSYWLKKSSLHVRHILFGVLILLAPISLFTTLRGEQSTIRAVAIRSDIYDSREESIQAQLHDNSPIIHFEPLPILLANSDAVDFYYDRTPPVWFEDGFRKYYSIPKDTEILYEPQPMGYCTTLNNPGWLGAKDCYVMQRQ